MKINQIPHKSGKKIEILHRDDEIIVINKPAGISVTRDRTGKDEIRDCLSRQLGKEPAEKLRLVHRLDKDTSGVMIIALTQAAQREFCGYFENRQVKKTYLAFVRGYLGSEQGRIDVPIGRSRSAPNLMTAARKKGKEAITEWTLLADFGKVYLLAVRPLTGRTHQIRVHLKSAQIPLAVDPLYGNGRGMFLSEFKSDYRLGKDKTEKPLLERLSLHCYQIELPAQKKRPFCFIAPPERKFAAAIKMLTKYNPHGPESRIDELKMKKILNGEKVV